MLPSDGFSDLTDDSILLLGGCLSFVGRIRTLFVYFAEKAEESVASPDDADNQDNGDKALQKSTQQTWQTVPERQIMYPESYSYGQHQCADDEEFLVPDSGRGGYFYQMSQLVYLVGKEYAIQNQKG